MVDKISQREVEKVRKLIIKQEQAQEDVNSGLRELQEKIRSGESTGDDVLDLAIVSYGSLNGEYQKPLRDLRERVDAHPGELVLLVQEMRVEDNGIRYMCEEGERFASGFIELPVHYDAHLNLQMGILDSVKFGIANDEDSSALGGSVIFPMEKHIVANYDYFDIGFPLMTFKGLEWSIKEGDIIEGLAELPHLMPQIGDYSMFSIFGSFPRSSSSSKVLIGDEIEEYFMENTLKGKEISDAYCKAVDLLES